MSIGRLNTDRTPLFEFVADIHSQEESRTDHISISRYSRRKEFIPRVTHPSRLDHTQQLDRFNLALICPNTVPSYQCVFSGLFRQSHSNVRYIPNRSRSRRKWLTGSAGLR